MTDIYLITGFLGSGKTTFLNQRLLNTSSKVGVLMNEFGKVSMDSVTVSKEGMSLLELTNGSIFCSCLKENFIQGLAHLLTLNLDEVYIESSGLSDPSDMDKVIQVIKGMVNPATFTFKGTLCLVDGVFFKKELEKMVSVERQIRHSHHILINKIDLISVEELNEIIQIIQPLNPKASISSVSFGNVDWDKLALDYFPIEDEESTNTHESRPRSLLITFIHEPERSKLELFLDAIKFDFYRAKGFVKIDDAWYKIDLVNERIDIKSYDGPIEYGRNEMVFLSSTGIESISRLAQAADKYIPGLFRLTM